MNGFAFLADVTFVLPIALVAVVAYVLGRSHRGIEIGSLERELMRRRRREEPAALLLVEGAGDPLSAPSLAGCLRLTDTVESRARRGRVRIRAILDEDGLDRDAVERRLLETAEAPLRIGWSTFPEDGFTLHVLEDVARARTAPVHPVATEPLVAPVGAAVMQEATS